MIEKIKKDFKINYKYYIFSLIIILLMVIKLDYYVYSPGSLVDLTDRINVENSYSQSGSFNLTYVTGRKGNLMNIILSYVIPSWDLERVSDSRIDEESTSEIEERNKIYLRETSYDAIIAAFSEAGINYKVNKVDVTVTHIFDGADTNIKVGDIIKSVDNQIIKNVSDLKKIISNYKENDKVNIKVLRKNKEIDCYSVLFKENESVYIGVSLAELKDITTSPKVEYVFKNNESGSSRGLMCALDIYNKITKFDLTKGRIISGTGVIDENGNVGEIDGVKYKLKGAVNKHADIFIVPEGNYEEAIKLKEKNKYDIQIIKADTLHNVIEALK